MGGLTISSPTEYCMQMCTCVLPTETLSVIKTADLTGHNAGIFTLGYSRDGRYLASG